MADSGCLEQQRQLPVCFSILDIVPETLLMCGFQNYARIRYSSMAKRCRAMKDEGTIVINNDWGGRLIKGSGCKLNFSEIKVR